MTTKRIMITGAAGQIGAELVKVLRRRHGSEGVLATDIQNPPGSVPTREGPFEFCDVTDRKRIEELLARYGIDIVYHMAAILSASGEKKPAVAWEVNAGGTFNILEAALARRVGRVFIPSSIAAFGPETPRELTPQETVLRPRTMYGITKVASELLGDYYVRRFNLDVRGCRFPGIVSHEVLPGGGTTDYAVAIFYEAVKAKKYTCFLKEDTRLPMMYMPDCLRAAEGLMDADFSRLHHHTDFNIASMSFSPAELAAEIRKHIPDFTCDYEPDYRQAIAESWPVSIDDTAARREWGWKPEYDLAAMTADMIGVLSRRLAEDRRNFSSAAGGTTA